MHDFDLIDLNTYVRLRQAAPQVTVVPGDIARGLVAALDWFGQTNNFHEDMNGRIYWQASLKELNEYSSLYRHNAHVMMLGKACREMGLAMVRKKGGYYAAWSQEQLKILKEYFPTEGET